MWIAWISQFYPPQDCLEEIAKNNKTDLIVSSCIYLKIYKGFPFFFTTFQSEPPAVWLDLISLSERD